MKFGIVPLSIVALVTVNACSSEPETPTFRGTRLGMSAKDVRDRFEAPNPGAWTVTPGEDMKLDWRAHKPSGDGITSARFEFHTGMLVAVRADLPPGDALARGPALSTTSASVLARGKRDGLVTYTLLARDCPTHKAEVGRILGP